MEYDSPVRRVSAIVLLALFSLGLIGPALSASETESRLPACCRRNGAHHCAISLRQPAAGGPAVESSRCHFYPVANATPAARYAGSPAVTGLGFLQPDGGHRIAVRPQPLLRDSFSRARQKRGPPALA